MRASAVILALPALAVAQQQQKPLKDVALDTFNEYLAKAQGIVATYTGNAPVQAAKEPVTPAFSHGAVTVLTMDNWKQIIKPQVSTAQTSGHDEWMVYITGRNKTCGGMCDRADNAWNEALTTLAADPSAPHLGYLNCEDEEILCGSWMAPAASIYYFLLPQPQPNQSPAKTPLYYIPLNQTTVTTDEIVQIHTEKAYLQRTEWTGSMHPIDGWVAQYGVQDPLAYGMYYLAKIPSWMFTIGISLFGRRFMASRMNPGGRAAAAAPAST